MLESEVSDSFEGVSDDRALRVELCFVTHMLPTTATAGSEMATAGLSSVGTRLDQTSHSSPGHPLPSSQIDELDQITRHPAIDEYDSTIG